MKKHLTLLLLLVSVCFYGQETVELEGFYKVSIGGGGHTFFPLVNNTVMAPLQLEVEIYKIPEGYVNSSRVKIKGTKVKTPNVYDCYHVRYKIVVDEIVLLDTNLLMNDFLKYYANKEKPNLKEGEEYVEYFEAEGFYTERLGEMYFIPLENGRPADTLGICFEGRASQKHNEVYPDKYVADGVYVKGSGLKITGRSYGLSIGYDSQFNFAELTEIDTTRTLNKYQQERKNKENQDIVELEGFYKVNGNEHLFFQLENDLVSVPFFLRLNGKKLPKSFNNTALIRVKGKKIKKPFFATTYSILYQIEADEVAVSDNNLLLEDYLKNYQVNKTELKEGEERLEYFEKDGYYLGPFEGHTFVWFENEEFQGDAWPFFDENITENIYVNGERGLGIKSSFKRGIYLKVKGIRTYGKRYGHYGGRESQVNISSVTEIDADKSLWEFIERKIREKGFYEYKKQKLTFPNILEEGKTYTFKSLAVCDCMLEAKRTGGYIDYTFTEKEGTAIKSRFSGRLIANPWTYDKEPDYNWTDYQVTYESVATESRVYDYSKFTVQVYREKYEDGSIWIAIEDYINDREFGLTEVKN